MSTGLKIFSCLCLRPRLHLCLLLHLCLHLHLRIRLCHRLHLRLRICLCLRIHLSLRFCLCLVVIVGRGAKYQHRRRPRGSIGIRTPTQNRWDEEEDGGNDNGDKDGCGEYDEHGNDQSVTESTMVESARAETEAAGIEAVDRAATTVAVVAVIKYVDTFSIIFVLNV